MRGSGGDATKGGSGRGRGKGKAAAGGVDGVTELPSGADTTGTGKHSGGGPSGTAPGGGGGHTARLSQITTMPQEARKARDTGLCPECEIGIKNTVAEIFGYNVANAVLRLAGRDESRNTEEHKAATVAATSVTSGAAGQREDSDWIKMLDEGTERRYFYYHVPSGESQWEQPHSWQWNPEMDGVYN